MVDDQAHQARAAARLQMYQQLGAVSDDVLAPIISASLMGNAPAWPVREAHRVISTDDGHLVFVTDGLTDQHDDGSPGLPYELMTKVPTPAGYSTIADASGMFEFAIHREMASNALVWPDLRPMLADNGVLSMVLPADVGASAFVADRDGQGQVGALIGAATVDGGVVPVIGVTLILPSEVIALEAGGSETRPALAAALDVAGHGWASVATRLPVSI
jgi:hypothetical protein